MALKGNRVVLQDDISLTCSSVTERGVGLVIKTSGSGVAIGDKSGTADLVSNPSGYVPAGLLMNDVVNIDQTRYHRNFHKDETMINERCRMLRKGVITTDQILSVCTPSAGDTCYLAASGQFHNAPNSSGGTVASPKFGQFKSGKDESGFATIEVMLPQV